MSVLSLVLLFKQKTAYEMRISDWSSDVCSSDLADRPHRARPWHRVRAGRTQCGARRRDDRRDRACRGMRQPPSSGMCLSDLPPLRDVIARHGLSAKKSLGQNFLTDGNLLTGRESVVVGKGGFGRGNIGGRRNNKKNKKQTN